MLARVPLFLLFLSAPIAYAAPLYTFTTGDSTPPNDDGYDPAVVTTTLVPNITAPADGAAIATGNVGLVRFWNSEFAGFSLTSSNGPSLDSAAEFATGYFTFTVAAQSGFALNPESLTFKSAPGGSGNRGFALYAQPNGQAFDFSDTPILEVTTETGSRAMPNSRTALLSDPAFQGANSITFRYYPITPGSGNSIDFSNVAFNGDVIPVPEPAALGLIAALFPLLRRRSIRR